MKYSGNRTSKYHSVRSGGFDSKKEAERYGELVLLQRAGRISGLQRQVRFTLIPAQYKDGKCIFRKCEYIADFVYTENGQTVVEDAKGFKTPEYIIKRKLMYYIHGILVIET